MSEIITLETTLLEKRDNAGDFTITHQLTDDDMAITTVAYSSDLYLNTRHLNAIPLGYTVENVEGLASGDVNFLMSDAKDIDYMELISTSHGATLLIKFDYTSAKKEVVRVPSGFPLIQITSSEFAAGKLVEGMAYTLEEMRELFYSCLKSYAEYWAATPCESVIEQIHGAIFGILNVIDGGTLSFPCSMDLVLRPHPEDKEFNVANGEKYVVDGMMLNEDILLHEGYYSRD